MKRKTLRKATAAVAAASKKIETLMMKKSQMNKTNGRICKAHIYFFIFCEKFVLIAFSCRWRRSLWLLYEN